MKQLLQEIREWDRSYIHYFKYSYKLTLWIYLARLRILRNFLKIHFDILLRLTFITLGLVIGILVILFGETFFTQDVLSSYLVTVGAMSGGAIAIVFTISIFMLQSAADLYSSQYFEVYIHDWKEKIIYLLVVIITILFFGAGTYIGGLETVSESVSQYVIFFSLVLIGAIFALIDWQYKTVRQKINPAKAIVFLENQGIKFLSTMQADAQKVADVMRARDSNLSENEALARSYNHFFQPRINDLDRQLENIVEISLKLADKQEVGTTKRGFIAVRNVLGKFLEVRKDSSVVIRSGTVLLAVESDSQRFLFNNFDRLNKAGEKFINEGKDENATLFLGIYEFLATKAKDITYIGRVGENPIFENIVGCLERYVDIGMRAKNLEVVFQSIDKLGSIASMASNKSYDPTLIGIQKKIESIALFGLREKHTIVIDQCNKNLLSIIYSVFTSKNIIRKFQFDSALRHIATIAEYVLIGEKGGYIQRSPFSLAKAYDEMYLLIVQILRHYDSLTEERERSQYRSDITDFFDKLYRSLRDLSGNLKDCDNLLVESIGRLLFNVNALIIQLIEDEDFKDEKIELRKQLSWNIYLPSWFCHHANKFDAGSNNFRSLTECVAKTGILVAERLDDEELLVSAISCLGSITEHAIEKNSDTYGYDEPRILEKACYLGVLALKRNWMRAFAETYVKIINFEPKYIQKYFSNLPPHIDPEKISPKKYQLYIEVAKWRNEFDYQRMNGSLRIRDDAESMMYPIVDVGDIDWFTFKVWGKWDADSPINDKIEKEIQRLNKNKAIENLIICISKLARK